MHVTPPFAATPTGEVRRMFDPATESEINAAVFERNSLGPGASLRGPAVIVESETTTVVPPGFAAHVDAFASLTLTRERQDP